MNTTPYVYILYFPTLDKRYIGVRYGKGCHPTDLLAKRGYITSSSVCKRLILSGEAVVIEYIETFDTPLEAREAEQFAIWLLDAVRSDRYLNAANGHGAFYNNWHDKTTAEQSLLRKKYSEGVLKAKSRVTPEEQEIINRKRAKTRADVYDAMSEDERLIRKEKHSARVRNSLAKGTPGNKAISDKAVYRYSCMTDDERLAMSIQRKNTYHSMSDEKKKSRVEKILSTKALRSEEENVKTANKRANTIASRSEERKAEIGKAISDRAKKRLSTVDPEEMSLRMSKVASSVKGTVTCINIFSKEIARISKDDPSYKVIWFSIACGFAKSDTGLQNMVTYQINNVVCPIGQTTLLPS